jgi:hypothetical protein
VTKEELEEMLNKFFRDNPIIKKNVENVVNGIQDSLKEVVDSMMVFIIKNKYNDLGLQESQAIVKTLTCSYFDLLFFNMKEFCMSAMSEFDKEAERIAREVEGHEIH